MLVIYIYDTKASGLSQSSVNIDYRTQTLAIHKNVRSTKVPPLETWPNNIKTWMKWKTLWSKKIVYIHASNTRLQNLAIVTVLHGVITVATLYDCKHTGDPLHSRAACTQPCNVNTHSRAHCSPGARLCEQWGHGCVNNGARLCASARLCRGSPVKHLYNN